MSATSQPDPDNAGNSSKPYCPFFGGNQVQCDAIVIAMKVSASFSVAGCLFVIVLIWLFKRYQAFSQRLILYLSIAAILNSICHIMAGLHVDGSLCDFKGWALAYTDWTVLLWVCSVTFNLFMVAVKTNRIDRYEWALHLLCWGLAFGVSLLPFIGNHYGPSGLWCWITNDTGWRFGIWYIPLFLAIGVMFAAYIYITITVYRQAKTWEGMYDPDLERSKQLLKEDIKPLRWYPVIYFLVYLFPLINRIQMAANHGVPNFVLTLLAAISGPLQGVGNALIFGMDRETTQNLNPTQIKLTIQNRFSKNDSLIQEYPTDRERETDQTDQQT